MIPAERTRGRKTRRTAAGGGILALTAAFALTLGAGPALAATSSGGNLSVEVTDGDTPSPTPTPSSAVSAPPSPAAPPRDAVTPRAPVPAQVTQATIIDPVSAETALEDATESGDGMLTMSGLSADAAPSLGIDNGSLTLSFVVRNATDEKIDATARFWVDNVVGLRLADVADVRVDALEPAETRRVLVRIDGLGQQAVLHSSVALTPPAGGDGEEPGELTRTTTVVVPPLFSISLAGGLGALGGVGWWTLRARGLGLRLGRLGG